MERKAVAYSKVWNLPNMLTYGRIAAVPAVAGLLMYGGNGARWTALVIYVAAAISDFLDGYLARLWHQQSSLGRMLDPIADKVLVAVVLLVLSAWRGGLNTIAGWVGVRGYPPAVLFAVGLLFVIVVLLHYSTVISRLTDQNATLAQRIALIESELRQRSSATRE